MSLYIVSVVHNLKSEEVSFQVQNSFKHPRVAEIHIALLQVGGVMGNEWGLLAKVVNDSAFQYKYRVVEYVLCSTAL